MNVVHYIICDCSNVLLIFTMTVSDCVQNKENRKHQLQPLFIARTFYNHGRASSVFNFILHIIPIAENQAEGPSMPCSKSLVRLNKKVEPESTNCKADV